MVLLLIVFPFIHCFKVASLHACVCLLVIVCVESILHFPSVGDGLLDIFQCGSVECPEVFKLSEDPIHWLVVVAEFDGDGQRSPVGLHSEVESSLVVELVFS